MFTDFKVIFLDESQNNLVNIRSTEKSRLTAGIFKLTQKVIHGLLTDLGDDHYAPNWGGSLLQIFDVPVDPKKEPEVYAQCRTSMKKVESDIISQQAQQESPTEQQASAALVRLDLLDVRADTENLTWRVDIRVNSRSGDQLSFSLP